MRISDWSSDVCSSDLLRALMLTTRRITLNWLRNQTSCGTLMKLVRLPLYHVREKPESQRVDLNLNFKDNIFFLATKQVEALEEVLVTEDIKAEIGRATCRERVCQYV